MRNSGVSVALLTEVMRVIDEVVDAPRRVVRWFYRNYVKSVPRLYQTYIRLYDYGFGSAVYWIWDGGRLKLRYKGQLLSVAYPPPVPDDLTSPYI